MPLQGGAVLATYDGEDSAGGSCGVGASAAVVVRSAARAWRRPEADPRCCWISSDARVHPARNVCHFQTSWKAENKAVAEIRLARQIFLPMVRSRTFFNACAARIVHGEQHRHRTATHSCAFTHSVGNQEQVQPGAPQDERSGYLPPKFKLDNPSRSHMLLQ